MYAKKQAPRAKKKVMRYTGNMPTAQIRAALAVSDNKTDKQLVTRNR